MRGSFPKYRMLRAASSTYGTAWLLRHSAESLYAPADVH